MSQRVSVLDPEVDAVRGFQLPSDPPTCLEGQESVSGRELRFVVKNEFAFSPPDVGWGLPKGIGVPFASVFGNRIRFTV